MARYNLEDGVAVLTPYLQEGRLALFGGSGISIDSGMPDWDTLLKKFVHFCESLPDSKKDSEFKDLIHDATHYSSRYPERVISALRDKLGEIGESDVNVEDVFRRWMGRIFTGIPNDNHRAIVSTNYTFIITSNYDELLEQAAADLGFDDLYFRSFNFEQASSLAMALYNKKPCIIHAHGNTNNIHLDNMVFTAQD